MAGVRTFRWHPGGEEDVMFRLADDVATEMRHCHVEADVDDEVLVNSSITDCIMMNSVIRNVSQKRLPISIPEEPDVKDNVYTSHLLGKLDKRTAIVTGSSNMNNNNDSPKLDALTTLGNQLVALLTGYMEFVDIDSITKLLRTYTIHHNPAPAQMESPVTDLVEVTCTASPGDITATAPIVDVVSSTGSIDQLVAAADALLRQLLRPVFGELPIESVAGDLTASPAVRHALASVDLAGMLISLTATLKDGRRTDPFPAPVLV